MQMRQVGGMQEVFLQLRWKTIRGVEHAVTAVEKTGGRVLHAYLPSIMVASVPSTQVDRLTGKGGILSATVNPLPQEVVRSADTETSFAVTAWNERFDLDRRLRALTSPELGKFWDETERQPPDPPEEVMIELRKRERELTLRAPATAPAEAPLLSIPVLVGRIAVGVIFVDSTVDQFAIAEQEKAKVLSETTEGLNMLSGFEPRANVQWFYDLQCPRLSLAADQFTEQNKTNWEDVWRDAAMQALGYGGSIDGMNAYINDIKSKNNASWAYAIFVTKYPSFHFAYCWGNHVVMDFEVDGWDIDNFSRVVAHETGHVFGCPDEYPSSGCTCTELAGRHQIANGNCESCASPFVPCLMAHNTPAVCDYTRGHLGWNELAVMSKGTTILKGTWTFDFETGAQGPPAGTDIWWEQVDPIIRFLVPRSGAMLAHMGQPEFDAVSLQALQSQPFTASPINGSDNASNELTPGSVIAVKTNAGRFAKMRINSYGYNLGISWVTYK